MTLQDNKNPRPDRDTRRRSEEPGWGIPLALGAIFLVGGLILFGVGDKRINTAANNTPGASSTQVQTETPPPATAPKQ
jgi:hypothetical protein